MEQRSVWRLRRCSCKCVMQGAVLCTAEYTHQLDHTLSAAELSISPASHFARVMPQSTKVRSRLALSAHTDVWVQHAGPQGPHAHPLCNTNTRRRHRALQRKTGAAGSVQACLRPRSPMQKILLAQRAAKHVAHEVQQRPRLLRSLLLATLWPPHWHHLQRALLA